MAQLKGTMIRRSIPEMVRFLPGFPWHNVSLRLTYQPVVVASSAVPRGEKRENTGASGCIEGVLADSQQAVMRPTVSNAVRQLEAGLNLREEIVEGKTPEGLFQFGFVVYKAVLAFGSNIAIWFRRVLP